MAEKNTPATTQKNSILEALRERKARGEINVNPIQQAIDLRNKALENKLHPER